MQTFQIGDTVILERPYNLDYAKGSVGCVTYVGPIPGLVEEQLVRVIWWAYPDKEPTYTGWRLKPL